MPTVDDHGNLHGENDGRFAGRVNAPNDQIDLGASTLYEGDAADDAEYARLIAAQAASDAADDDEDDEIDPYEDDDNFEDASYAPVRREIPPYDHPRELPPELRPYQFRYEGIDAEAKERSHGLLRSRIGQQPDERAEADLQSWADDMSAHYGMDAPQVFIDRNSFNAAVSGGYYDAENNHIVMPRPANVTAFRTFRQAMQAQGKVPSPLRTGPFAGDESTQDARGWAHSMYYSIAPKDFNRLVREGKMMFADEQFLVDPPEAASSDSE